MKGNAVTGILKLGWVAGGIKLVLQMLDRRPVTPGVSQPYAPPSANAPLIAMTNRTASLGRTILLPDPREWAKRSVTVAATSVRW